MRDPELLHRAKEMRTNPTPAEARLWYHLRAHRFENHKFRHQTVLAPYIVDFTSRTAMLAIEVDGDTHATQQDYDARRTRFRKPGLSPAPLHQRRSNHQHRSGTPNDQPSIDQSPNSTPSRPLSPSGERAGERGLKIKPSPCPSPLSQLRYARHPLPASGERESNITRLEIASEVR
jgi:hypothetical protein